MTDSAAQGRLVSIARYTLANATPPPAAAAVSSSFLSSYSSASSPEPPPRNDSNTNSGKRVTATVYTHGSNTEPSFASSFKVLKWDVLHLMDMSANSNKYYSIEMHEAESGASLYRYRLFNVIHFRQSREINQLDFGSSRIMVAQTRLRHQVVPALANVVTWRRSRRRLRYTIKSLQRNSILKRGRIIIKPKQH